MLRSTTFIYQGSPNRKGGDEMVLTLYRDKYAPYSVYNVVKVTVDDLRTLVATTKHGVHINHQSYRHETDYQRLTIQVD